MESISNRQKYVRIQVRYTGKTGKPVGIFGACHHVINSSYYSYNVTEEEKQLFQNIDNWFIENLPNPPFYEEGNPNKYITWFKTKTTNDMIIKLSKEMGYKAIIIYGDPEYYKRFGFKESKEYRITNKDKKFPAALLVLELYPNALNGIEGIFDEGKEYEVDKKETAKQFHGRKKMWRNKTVPRAQARTRFCVAQAAQWAAKQLQSCYATFWLALYLFY
ncbi:MAG: hypothetical protein LBV17_10280 [Treponema sp.]|jgi:hypothetical protein|nr:hypothetical protein [Treponema sp.]